MSQGGHISGGTSEKSGAVLQMRTRDSSDGTEAGFQERTKLRDCDGIRDV